MASDVSCGLEDASATGDLEKVKRIMSRFSKPKADGLPLEQRVPPGGMQVIRTSLCRAARNGHTEIVSYFSKQGVPLEDVVMQNTKTAQSTSQFEALLTRGWDINSMDYDSTTLSKNLNNEDVLKWLLEHGADPNIANRRGITPLETAAYQYPLSTVQLLVQHGADLRYTPAVHAAAANSANLMASSHPTRVAIMDFLLDSGADVNMLEPATRVFGRPRVTMHTGRPLHCAVESQDPEHVRFLLSRGADPNLIGAVGKTPLQLAEQDAECEEDRPDSGLQETTLKNLYEIINLFRSG